MGETNLNDFSGRKLGSKVSQFCNLASQLLKGNKLQQNSIKLGMFL